MTENGQDDGVERVCQGRGAGAWVQGKWSHHGSEPWWLVCLWAAVVAAAMLPPAGVAGSLVLSELPPAAEREVDFVEDIKPIFERSCLQCHGRERPKSDFRLTNREEALAGGNGGTAILPGDSAASPMIYYVSGLDEDIRMPPLDKAPALTEEEVALLRAWIDQGAKWGETETEQSWQYSARAGVRWIGVEGNERQFREQWGFREGWAGGVESFSLERRVDKDSTVRADGHAMAGDEDFRLRVEWEERDLGFVRAGLSYYQEWFDDTGGYYPLFDHPVYRLGRDLELSLGRAWIEAGLDRPGGPVVILGYEYRVKEGEKATLQWGRVTDDSGTSRRIYPAAKAIDEQIHLIRLSASHEEAGVRVENDLRTEFYDLKTERENALAVSEASGALEKGVQVEESQDDFRISDSIRLEKKLRGWWLVSGGYLFSLVDGEAAFSQSTFVTPGSGVGVFPDDKFWFGKGIQLEQTTHIFNLNSLWGPWAGFSLSAGVQNSWMRQKGFGNVRLDEGMGSGFGNEDPAAVVSDLDRMTVEERVGMRYTRIPYTVLFAEGKLEQESWDQFEEEVGGHHEFLRDTDADSDLAEYRAGLTVSPFSRVMLKTHYKTRNRESRYDHLRDEAFGMRNEGYSAFIRSREVATDEAMVRLSLRWTSWLRSALSYRHVKTEYTTETDPYIIPALAIPGLPPFPAEEIAAGGSMVAGNYRANIYGFRTTVRPIRKLQVTASLTMRSTEMETGDNGLGVVADYEGEAYSVLSHASYVLDAKTRLSASYDYSWADYRQRHFAAGLPLGVEYGRHGVRAGVSRQLRDNITGAMRYVFFAFDELSRGGASDFTAHGIFSTIQITFR